MSAIDNDLQERMQDGSPTPLDDRDAVAYHKLFAILNGKQEYSPSRIEDAVISKIEARTKSTVVLDYVWLTIGVVALVTAGVAAVALSGLRISMSEWQWNIIALGLCGGLVIGVFNAIERKLLKA